MDNSKTGVVVGFGDLSASGWARAGVLEDVPDSRLIDEEGQPCGWWCGCADDNVKKKGLGYIWYTGVDDYDANDNMKLFLAHCAPQVGGRVTRVSPRAAAAGRKGAAVIARVVRVTGCSAIQNGG